MVQVAGFIQEKALLDYESSILPSIELQLMKILMTWLREMPGTAVTKVVLTCVSAVGKFVIFVFQVFLMQDLWNFGRVN